jgi:hypothetical protein
MLAERRESTVPLVPARRQFALALYRAAYDAFLPHYDQDGCSILRVRLTRTDRGINGRISSREDFCT